jgi:hypothetical protein
MMTSLSFLNFERPGGRYNGKRIAHRTRRAMTADDRALDRGRQPRIEPVAS